MKNLSCESEFDLHENEPVSGTHFHFNGFARRVVLTQRQKTTQKSDLLSLLEVHRDIN